MRSFKMREVGGFQVDEYSLRVGAVEDGAGEYCKKCEQEFTAGASVNEVHLPRGVTWRFHAECLPRRFRWAKAIARALMRLQRGR